jgi:pimeloyl-ACP methyl ester carboxylesterase
MLYVFIEGDGSPWVDAGTRVAQDPTPHRPLALELAAATPHAVLYLGRPCYFELHLEAICTPDLWTSGRYSAAVVDSLAAAVRRYAAANDNPPLILIGYSGGGALAVLMAAHLPATHAVVTIAANLDVDAWARWHRYLPLSAGENPATEPPLADAILQWHMVGGKDDNVPEAVNRRYFDTLRPDQVWRYPDFDHACCWLERWASILARIEAAIYSVS